MRPGAADLRGATASLYARANRVGAGDERSVCRRGRSACHDRGPAAVADGPAGRLPVRVPLLARRAALPRRLSRHGSGWRGTYRRLLEGRGAMSAEPLLRVEGLRKHFAFTKGILFARTLGHVKAVDD